MTNGFSHHYQLDGFTFSLRGVWSDFKILFHFSMKFLQANRIAPVGTPRSASLLSEGLSEPEFYGDLVYKLKKLKGINDFSLQFGKIISRYRRIGYNLNVMRQSACLVFNPIMVDNYAAFFNCTPVGRASDSMMAPT